MDDVVRRELLARCSRLKSSSFSQVYISRDLTRAQRQELLRRRGALGRGAGRPAAGGADR